MSMNYGVVKPTFWTGATGRALRQDVDAQVVALYLMTSPHANIIGVFRCPIGYIAAETGRPFEGASKGLLKLVAMGFCTVDSETETVWVHEMARFQIGDALKGADKRVKHVARFFNEIENPLIKRAFFEKYGTAYQLVEPPETAGTGSPFEGASEIAPSPIEATVTVTVTNTVTDTVTTHPSGESENLKSKPAAKSARKPKPPTTPVPDGERLDALKLEFLVQADKRRIGAVEAKEQFERFIDHHRSKANEFADWHAAGRNWLRNTAKFGGKPIVAGGQRANGGFTNLLLEQQAERMNGSVTIDHDDYEFAPIRS